MDDSTDAANKEEELITVLYCKKDDGAHKVRSYIRYLSVQVPTRADVEGVIECLSNTVKEVGLGQLLDRESVLGREGAVVVGGGTDGASVNNGEHRGIKGTMQIALPLLFWAWYYSYRLELTCKDGSSSKLFKDIEEMLLKR